MDLNEYASLLGKIWCNFIGLETALRFYLYAATSPNKNDSARDVPLSSLVVGLTLPVNAFTDYRSMASLISDYNKNIRAQGLLLEVDPTLVDVRDALAHGRSFALEPELPVTLVKFTQPKDEMTKVVVVEVLSRVRLVEWGNRVGAAVKSVAEAAELLHIASYGESAEE